MDEAVVPRPAGHTSGHGILASVPGGAQENLDPRALQLAALSPGDLVHHGDQAFVAGADDLRRHLVGHLGRRGAGALGVLEGEGPAKRAARTTSMVCSRSSSVSPGKPTMMSVVIAASGIAARTRSTMPRNRSRRYERRIRRSTASEPDCSGMCSCGITFPVVAIASITSSVKSRGCGLVNRTCPTRRLRRTPGGGRRTPRLAEVAAVGVDVLAEQGDLDHARLHQRPNLGQHVTRPTVALPPRSAGTMQKVQVLLQPTLIDTQAECAESRREGSVDGRPPGPRGSRPGPRARPGARASRAGRLPMLWVPKTTSTHGARRTISLRSFCARQPPTAICSSGLASLSGRRCPRLPYRRLSAFSRTAQVLKTMTSAACPGGAAT